MGESCFSNPCGVSESVEAMAPRVSVVMSVYNGEEWVKEAIESILKQTYRDFEFIIGNDGSTDGTKDILARYKDPRLRIMHFQKRLTLTYALNRLLKQIKGEYIARMDADDIASRERLARQVAFLDSHPEVGIVGSWYEMMRASGEALRAVRTPVTDIEIRRSVIRSNPICHPTMMFRKQLLSRIGPYDPDLNGAEDYDFVLRALTVTQIANIPEVLLSYRIVDTSVSIQHMDRVLRQTVRARWKAIRHYGYPRRHALFAGVQLFSSLIPPDLKVKFFRWVGYW